MTSGISDTETVYMWAYDPSKKSTGDGQDLIKRTELEEAADRLWNAGIKNQRVIEDVLKALSGLSRGEVRFNVEILRLHDLRSKVVR